MLTKQEYINQWKRMARRKRGLQKSGRKPMSDDDRAAAKIKNDLYREQYSKDHPYHLRPRESRLLWAATKRAKAKELPFNLTIEDIVIPILCPYTGVELTNHSPRGQSRTTVASLDRVVPELGYVKGNVEVISHLANTMKSNATVRQLQNFALEVLKRYPL